MLRNNTYFKRISLMFFIILIILTLYANKIVSSKDNILNEKPIAVMIGNSPAEQDIQKGLSKAELIYEIEVEFPFTRLMAIFLNDQESIVGPVRSSRYYFSRICAEWLAVFAHCGGQSLKNPNILDIDQMHNSSPYWRNEKIGGWINLFTSTTKITQEIKEYSDIGNIIQYNHNLLNFTELDLKNINQIKKITVKYHSDYIISYEYHDIQEKYYRYINQKPHIDQANGEQIGVSNIIIQYTSVEKIEGDDEGRVNVELIGEGIARIFSRGTYRLVKWMKENKNKPTLFLDEEGLPIAYSHGNTLIHLLSKDSEVWFK